MFIEHIDQLRCTARHEDIPLVAAFARREDRFIVDGTLGCPICERQYPIVSGIAYFGRTPADVSTTPAPPANNDLIMRAAAFLNAAERSSMVLGGAWAAHAHGITQLLPSRIFALNPSAIVEESEAVSVIESSERVPLAPASVHGIALDSETASDSNMQSALAVLFPAGRLVAPSGTAVPDRIKILARDDEYWVGEKEGPLVSLRRA